MWIGVGIPLEAQFKPTPVILTIQRGMLIMPLKLSLPHEMTFAEIQKYQPISITQTLSMGLECDMIMGIISTSLIPGLKRKRIEEAEGLLGIKTVL